ncbi:MAG: glutathione S-transferase family protein [Comamonadaceae bacterium]|nr:MAG: glutathione S-transferase family protein [Comamonadaceae bacterium]
MTTTLFTAPLSMFGAKAWIALREKGVAFERVMVPFDKDDRYQPKHPEVLRINPKGQVPVLVDPHVELFDSTQILEYLEDRYPEPALWPREVAARARARQLEMLADEVFFPHVVRLFPLQDDMKSEAARAACAACAQHYEAMDVLLATSDHLAGDYSYADIGLYMAHVFAERKGAGMTAATPRLMAWRDRVGARAAVRDAVGPMMRFLASEGWPVPAFLQSHLAD